MTAQQAKPKKKKKNGKATTRSPLTRERVVACALDIVDREGLDALTMRAIGRECDCDPMAIYRHFRDKDELVDVLAEAAWLEIELPPEPLPGTWQEQFKEAFRIFRAALGSHPQLIPLVATHAALTPDAIARTEFALDILVKAGFSPGEAMMGLSTMACFAIGCVLGETGSLPGIGSPSMEDAWAFYSRLSPAEFPNISAVLTEGEHGPFKRILEDGTSAASAQYEWGMDLIVGGLERTLARRDNG